MIRVFILLFLLVYLGTASGAEQLPKSFSHLSRLDVGETKGYVFIYYNAKMSKILNYEIESSEHPGNAIRAIETKIDFSKEDMYIIDYDSGPSGDPHFIVFHQLNGN